MTDQNKEKKYFVHPSSFVDEGAQVGEGTKIWHFSHVMAGAKIGRNCVLGQNVYIGGRADIGEGVKIQNNVSVFDPIVLEDHVFVGPSAVLTNVKNPRSHVSRKEGYTATFVRKGATLGANCTVVCGVEIGEYALIGAGAVVTKNVEAHAVITGVPGRRTGWACACGGILPDRRKGGACPDCGKPWEL
ncbi:MAG: DapH/DapD/GlmU-related protein [Pseudomonadota bacterium]